MQQQSKSVSELVGNIHALARDYIDLFVLETKISINAFVWILVFAIVAALSLVTAWLALNGLAAFLLLRSGLMPEAVIGAVGAGNLLMTYIGWRQAQHYSHRLGWPTLYKSIIPAPDKK